MRTATGAPTVASLLQDFFCQRLIAQRNASPRTVESYRDTFRLLLRYLDTHLGKAPVALTLADLDAPVILRFLDHLEQDRKNSPRSRNARLAAIRSFLRYASFQAPTALPGIQRVLAIPMKRFNRPLLEFLTRDEMHAIIAAPNRSTWSGWRDQVLLATLYNTGARVSEIAALRVADVRLDHSSSLCLHGKGRKERTVPLWKSTAATLKQWIAQHAGPPDAPVFPNRQGHTLTRSGIEQRLRLAVQRAAQYRPTLRGRRISPHSIRHTTALHLLQSGVDLTVIALWLGHESPVTTHGYVEADLTMKERALKKMQAAPRMPARFRAPERVLAFLDAL